MVKKNVFKARVIYRKSRAILLEVTDSSKNPYRFTLPESEIVIGSDGSVELTSEQISLGIPYGIPWESILSDSTISSLQLSSALHSNGIWTLADLQDNPDGAKNALFSCLRLSLADLIRKAKEFQSKE